MLDEDDTDEDEYMPSTVDYSKKIERAKQKSAEEIDKITHFEQLQKKALSHKNIHMDGLQHYWKWKVLTVMRLT